MLPVVFTPAIAYTLTGVVRDFHASHVDFENGIGVDVGIVESLLGPDGKPVYAGGAGTATTHGQAPFDQWFRDVPGVNLGAPAEITLTWNGSSAYEFSSSAYFPIDGQLFGNTPGYPHNYHFTHEFVAQFTYQGVEFSVDVFGDDDIWVFINHRLAIDLGGVHAPMVFGVTVGPANEATFGLTPGNTYDLALFRTERHTLESNLSISTSLELTQGGTSAVSDGIAAPVMQLASAAPNPFGTRTTLSIELPELGPARLQVYDAAGRRVATLLDGTLPAGFHVVEWDGYNHAGVSMAPGVYFMRLTTADRVTTRKLVKIRE